MPIKGTGTFITATIQKGACPLCADLLSSAKAGPTRACGEIQTGWLSAASMPFKVAGTEVGGSEGHVEWWPMGPSCCRGCP
jgi:hypothetical protein